MAEQHTQAWIQLSMPSGQPFYLSVAEPQTYPQPSRLPQQQHTFLGPPSGNRAGTEPSNARNSTDGRGTAAIKTFSNHRPRPRGALWDTPRALAPSAAAVHCGTHPPLPRPGLFGADAAPDVTSYGLPL